MAKKKTTIEENMELVTNCDLKNMDIKSMIRIIRGQHVMLDFELAMLGISGTVQVSTFLRNDFYYKNES